MASKTNTCKVADPEFDSFWRKYKDFVHQVRSSVNDSHERIRTIINPSFAVGRLN